MLYEFIAFKNTIMKSYFRNNSDEKNISIIIIIDHENQIEENKISNLINESENFKMTSRDSKINFDLTIKD